MNPEPEHDFPIPVLPDGLDPNVEWYHCVVDQQGPLVYHGYMQANNLAAVLYLDELCGGEIGMTGITKFMKDNLHKTVLTAGLEENSAVSMFMNVPSIKRPTRFLYAYRTEIDMDMEPDDTR